MTTIITYAGQYASQLRTLNSLLPYAGVDEAIAAIAPVTGDLPARIKVNNETYCYASAEDAERDQDGSHAVLVLQTVGRDSIRILREEACDAGDEAQIALCTAALDGDDAAWLECVDAIASGAVK